jgi:cytochrome c2
MIELPVNIRVLIVANTLAYFGDKEKTFITLTRGYTYRGSYTDNPLVWTDETMLQYLENPTQIIPGKKMMFTGLKKQKQREELLAFLKSATN